jgi:hypothetical protein
MMQTVAVLFARADSVYKTLPDCDVWDIERDALRWPGGAPVVAHPPCRAWGRLSHMAKPRAGEKQLAIWAVGQVRRFGGVLEHPRGSRLWAEMNLPRPGQFDSFGGFTIGISQHWWGHRAEKLTLLYVVGLDLSALPPIPLSLERPTHVIAQARQARPDLGRGRLVKGMPKWRPEVSAAERERTPPQLAEWLCQVARLCARRVEVAA